MFRGAIAVESGRRSSGPSRALPALALVLIAADVASIDVPFLRRATGRLETLTHPDPPPIARLAASDPASRVLMLRYDLFFGNDWIRWRARSMSGFHPAVPRTWDELRRSGLLGREAVMAALAVRYIGGEGIDARDTSRFTPVGLSVWRLVRARPRISAVSRVVEVSDDRAVVAAVSAPDFDPRASAITTDAGAGGDYPGSIGCTIRLADDGSDHLALDVTAAAPAFVVVADADAPGWRARVDGADARLHRVDGYVRGVRVPAGRHRVTMDYAPPGASVSFAAARVAWGLWNIAGAAAAWSRRRSRAAREGLAL
jgi:hypothetical protein